jgi:acylphosphatase
MAITRMRAVVEGRVQGVFFRDYTSREARHLCLTGWVRNLADGSVEAEFQGEETEVARMVQWLHQGSPLSQVTLVRTTPCPPVQVEAGFVVRY